MKWTKEKPTKEGFYFFRQSPDAITIVIQAWYYKGKLYAGGFPPSDGQWAGPIEEPKD